MDKNTFRLFFPVNITLFSGDPSAPDIEPYYTEGISQQYVEKINKAFLKHPMTNIPGNGLLKYFFCDDEIMDFFIKSKITCARPAVEYVGDVLYGTVAFSVNSGAPLPDAAIDALKSDLEQQLAEGWGQNEFDIAIDTSERKYEELQNATLNVRFFAPDIFIDTMEELQSRIDTMSEPIAGMMME